MGTLDDGSRLGLGIEAQVNGGTIYDSLRIGDGMPMGIILNCYASRLVIGVEL